MTPKKNSNFLILNTGSKSSIFCLATSYLMLSAKQTKPLNLFQENNTFYDSFTGQHFGVCHQHSLSRSRLPSLLCLRNSRSCPLLFLSLCPPLVLFDEFQSDRAPEERRPAKLNDQKKRAICPLS